MLIATGGIAASGPFQLTEPGKGIDVCACVCDAYTYTYM